MITKRDFILQSSYFCEKDILTVIKAHTQKIGNANETFYKL